MIRWYIPVFIAILMMLSVIPSVVPTAQAKSYVPTVKTSLQYNPANGHYYFNPTFPCLYGDVANVQVTNTTSKPMPITWNGKTTTLSPKKSMTAFMKAYPQLGDGRDPAIIVTSMYGAGITIELDITAEAVVPGCIGHR